MFMYEKDGKLVLNFQQSQIPTDNGDIELYKKDGTVHAVIGNTEMSEDNKSVNDTQDITEPDTPEQETNTTDETEASDNTAE